MLFLRPLFPRLSDIAEYGVVGKSEQVREQGSLGWGTEDPESVIYLTLQCWNSRPRASLIPRVIPLGRKLVKKNRNAWTTSRHTQRIMKSQCKPSTPFSPPSSTPIPTLLLMFSSCQVQIAQLILISGVWEADGAFFFHTYWVGEHAFAFSDYQTLNDFFAT